MHIEEMTRADALSLVASMPLGRLAYALNDQPYVTPLSFALEGDNLFGFSTVGQKITCMRANPKVCVEFERIKNQQEWATVLIGGLFEELDHGSGYSDRAYSLLSRRAAWWQPGYIRTDLASAEHPLEPVYFRIQIVKISGRRSVSDEPRPPRRNLWQRICREDGQPYC